MIEGKIRGVCSAARFRRTFVGDGAYNCNVVAANRREAVRVDGGGWWADGHHAPRAATWCVGLAGRALDCFAEHSVPEIEEPRVCEERFRLRRAGGEFLPRREPVLIFEPRGLGLLAVKITDQANCGPAPTQFHLIPGSGEWGARAWTIASDRDGKRVLVDVLKGREAADASAPAQAPGCRWFPPYANTRRQAEW